MKILFISAWFPYPPDNGSRIRIYNILKALSVKHEVFLASLMQEDSDAENISHLSDICEVLSLHKSRWFKSGTIKSVLGYFSPKPRSYIDTYDPRVEKAVCDAIDKVKPDVILASQLGAMVYVPRHTNIFTVFEELEVGSIHRQIDYLSGIKRMRKKLTLIKQINLTKELLKKSNIYTCVSENELELIKKYYSPKIDGYVVPNGVDTQRYKPDLHPPVANTLLYNGALTYGANLDAVRYFASEIYPILSKRYPEIRLRVTGRTDGVDLGEIKNSPGVELTGYVDDIRTELSRAVACVVPLREGGGSRLKILEAMAAGVPVISTRMGIEGIDAKDGEHALIANTPNDFLHSVDSIFSNNDFADMISKNARSLVEEQYSWKAIGENFDNILMAAVNNCTHIL